MRTLPWLLAVMLIAAPALTGCIGDDGGGEDEPGDETNDTGDAGDGSGDGSEEGGFGADDEDEASWRSENRTGTVSPTSQVTGDGASETFTVEDGAEELALNLSASGGELNMCIMKPGGNSSGNSSGSPIGAQQEACTQTETTQDGDASFQASSPTSGGWTVKLTAAQGTTSEVDYTLTIAQKVPLDEQATDDEDSGDGSSTAQRATVAP